MESTGSDGELMWGREFSPHLDFHEIFGLGTKSQSLENYMYFKIYLLIYDRCVIQHSI